MLLYTATPKVILIVLVSVVSSHPPVTSKGMEHMGGEPIPKTTVELITTQGYPAETYYVTTSDGYVLALHRIPGGKDNNKGAKKPVVFLQHGILSSSADWVINLANESLGFILADAGFDVWMGNIRGNTYSRNHTHLTPSDKQFWDFTFDEHAKYDLPAMIDYVLKITQEEKLTYVGYSQGTIMGFAGFSTQPDLAAKIKLFIALAPVARVSHIEGALSFIAKFYKQINFLFNVFGVRDFLPSDEFTRFIASKVCPLPLVDSVCGNVLFLIVGFDEKHLNMSRLPVYLSHTPAGTSVKNLVHYGQEVSSARFDEYDYGSAKANMEHYGQPSPPDYNISASAVKTATFSGNKDWIANPTDVEWLLPQIKQHVFHKTVDYYDHLDFVWSTDAATVLYPDVIKLIKTYI